MDGLVNQRSGQSRKRIALLSAQIWNYNNVNFTWADIQRFLENFLSQDSSASEGDRSEVEMERETHQESKLAYGPVADVRLLWYKGALSVSIIEETLFRSQSLTQEVDRSVGQSH